MSLNNKEIICGKNSVIDALKNGLEFEIIYSTKPFDFPCKSQVKIISKDEMNKITQLNHQGLIGVLKSKFQYYDINKMIKNKPEIILILDHIEDPHNFGAILRTTNAAGIKNIIIPDKRASQINETVLRISSGGFLNINISKTNSLQVIIDKLKENGYWIYASAIEKGCDYTKVKYNFPLAIVVGNECKGISKTILKSSDQNIYIPMHGSVQSLNVSVATGILLFEIIKNKN